MPTLQPRVACITKTLTPVMLAKRIARVQPRAWLVAMTVLLSSGVSIAAEDTGSLRATTLSGVDVTVPDPERAGVLVVGFGRAAARQVRGWRLRIDGLESAPSVASVLVIDEMPRLVRAALTRGMRGEVSEERQETIYLVTEDGEAWRDLVQVKEGDGADDAYVVRFDGQGQVCFRHGGEVTDAAAAGLLAVDCGRGSANGDSEQPPDSSTWRNSPPVCDPVGYCLCFPLGLAYAPEKPVVGRACTAQPLVCAARLVRTVGGSRDIGDS